MGGFGQTPPAQAQPTPLGPYAPDGARRMPSWNSQATLDAGRRKRTATLARSGRESTRLVKPQAGVTPYAASFLGSTL